jgi:hypothetical protein
VKVEALHPWLAARLHRAGTSSWPSNGYHDYLLKT